jgi:Flp pilus assembly protein TadB
MSSRWAIVATACVAVLALLVSGSAAAGLAILGYGLAGIQVLARRRNRGAAAQARAASLEMLACAAADLRAGAVAPPLLLPDRDLDRLARVAQRISDRTGAPLADLLDRLEHQQSALSRLDRAAHAQGAGLRTSAALLLCLPWAGLVLGHLIGANALGVLLRTPVGQVCAALAVALQLAGLAWTDRLARMPEKVSVATGKRQAGLAWAGPPGDSAPKAAVSQRRWRTWFASTRVETEGPVGPWHARLSGARDQAAGPWGRWRAWLAGTRGEAAGRRGRWRAHLARTPQWPAVRGRWSMPRRPLARLLNRPDSVAAPAVSASHGELAAAADLIAASLRAGAPVSAAVLAAGETLAGPLSPSLVRIGQQLRLGVPPAEAWRPLAAVAAAGRVIAAARRSAESGAALSGALTRCADDLRTDAEHDRQARAQRAAVLLVLPLGLCFLPAFVLAGLVPVVLAVLGEVL